MSEKKKGKLKIGPTMSIQGGKFKPDEQVNVKTIYGQYGIKGQYESGDKKLRISGSVTKDVTKGKVDFPGGSEKFKAEGKPYYRIDIEKKFGGPDPKKDLSKFIDDKKKGGVIKAYKGKAIKQPTETKREFEMRHEEHTNPAMSLNDYYKDIL